MVGPSLEEIVNKSVESPVASLEVNSSKVSTVYPELRGQHVVSQISFNENHSTSSKKVEKGHIQVSIVTGTPNGEPKQIPYVASATNIPLQRFPTDNLKQNMLFSQHSKQGNSNLVHLLPMNITTTVLPNQTLLLPVCVKPVVPTVAIVAPQPAISQTTAISPTPSLQMNLTKLPSSNPLELQKSQTTTITLNAPVGKQGSPFTQKNVFKLPVKYDIKKFQPRGMVKVPVLSFPKDAKTRLLFKKENGQFRLLGTFPGIRSSASDAGSSSIPNDGQKQQSAMKLETGTPETPKSSEIIAEAPEENVQSASLAAALSSNASSKITSCNDFLSSLWKIVKNLSSSASAELWMLMQDLVKSRIKLGVFRSKFQDLLKSSLTAEHLLFLNDNLSILVEFLVTQLSTMAGTSSTKATESSSNLSEDSNTQHAPGFTAQTPTSDVSESRISREANSTSLSGQINYISSCSIINPRPTDSPNEALSTPIDLDSNIEAPPSALTEENVTAAQLSNAADQSTVTVPCVSDNVSEVPAPATDSSASISAPATAIPSGPCVESNSPVLEPESASSDYAELAGIPAPSNGIRTTTSIADIVHLNSDFPIPVVTTESPSGPSNEAATISESTNSSTNKGTDSAANPKVEIEGAGCQIEVPVPSKTPTPRSKPPPLMKISHSPCVEVIDLEPNSPRAKSSGASFPEVIDLEPDSPTSTISASSFCSPSKESSVASAYGSLAREVNVEERSSTSTRGYGMKKRKVEFSSEEETCNLPPSKRTRFSLRPCKVVLRVGFHLKVGERDFTVSM